MVGADDEEEVVQPGKPLPAPYEPIAKERAIHDLTHLPYRDGCEHCVRARRPNTHHRARSPSSQRTIPLLVADDCHVRDSKDEELATILVARLYPSKALLAAYCDQKGVDDYAITRLAACVTDTGYTKVVYKSDQESSTRAMCEQAFRRSGRHGECYNPQLKQFIPEAAGEYPRPRVSPRYVGQ